MTRMAGPEAVPREIQRKLAGMLLRARLVAVVRGLAVVTGSLLAAVLLAIGADHFLMGYVERYVIIYEWPVRLAVTLSILLVAVVVTALAVVRPLIRRFSDSGIAQTIEESHPELQERLSSTVELLASKDPEVLRGSNEMIGILTDQAAMDARGLSLRGMIRWDRAARFWAVTALIALTAGTIAFRWPGPFLLSLQRLFIANLERVGQTELVIVGDGDRVVPEGEPVMIQAEARGRPVASAWLLIRDHADRLKTVKMEADQDQSRVFACTLPRTRGAWQYQVRAGDSHTRWYTVRAVPRPAVMGIGATIRAPAYSGRPVRTLENLPDTTEVLRHSRIELTVRTNKPVARGVLQFDRDRPVELSTTTEPGTRYTVALTALDDASFRVLLVDEHELDNVSPARYHIRVVRDEPPSVAITQPGRRVTLQVKDKLPIRFTARDDIAITKAELLVTVGVDEPMVLPIKLPQAGQPRVEAETALDLAAVGADLARQVTYRVRVSDSLPTTLDNGPQTAVSAEHVVMIDAAAQTFKMQVLQSVRRQFKTALEQVAELLKASQKQTAKLKTAAVKKQPYTQEQLDETDAARKALRKAEKLAYEISELTAYTDYRNLGRMLGTDIAQRHIAPAEQLVTQARLLPRKDAERADRFGRAEFEITRALEKLTTLSKQFDDTAIYQETAQALADAAARQADLAERIRQLSELEIEPGLAGAASRPVSSQPVDLEFAQRAAAQTGTTQPDEKPDRLDVAGMAKLTKEQEALIKASQEIIALHPELWQPALEIQQARSKTLLEQIRDLGKRQEELAKLATEQQTRDKAKGRREELAKAQIALVAQVAKLAKDHAELLKQAGAQPPDQQEMAQAAAEVLDERLARAVELQSKPLAELAKIAEAAEAEAKKLTKSAPDPKPHQQRAATSKGLAGQAATLAQQQRHLAIETGKTDQQRQIRQRSLAQADAKLQQQMADLNKRHGASVAEVGSFIDRIRTHARLSSELGEVLKKSAPTAIMKEAQRKLEGKRPDEAATAQQSAVAKLGAIGKAIAESAKRARQENARLKTESDKWSAAEAKRLEAIKKYQAEMARRGEALKKWRLAEANRKASLAKWQAEQQAKRKAATTQKAKKQPASKPASTQQVARATTQKALPQAQPPKALITPIPEPKFGPLAKPAEKPAPRPQPKRPLWNEEQLKAAHAFAAEAGSVTKRLEQLRAETAAVAKQAKQLNDQQTSQKDQIGQQDGALLKRQEALHKAAGQLMGQTAKLGPELKKVAEANTPVPSMAEAVKAIKAHELSSVPKVQVAAAERLDALAKALQAESDRAKAAAAVATNAAAEARRRSAAQQGLAKQAKQLQQQQAQLHQQTQKLAKQLAPLGPNLRDKIVRDLHRQQQALAEEATVLSDELATPEQADGVEMPARPDPVAQSSAMGARRVAEALQALADSKDAPAKTPKAGEVGKDKPTPAPFETVMALQENVAGQLDRLVERLQEPVEEDPARWEQQATEEFLRIQHAERAAELAARQRRLARQLERTMAGKPMQALALEQDELRKKVGDFAQAAEFLAEQIEVMEPKVPALKPKILANATKATELLAKTAPTAMETASKALSEDHASQAVKPMTDAAKAVAEAHRLLGTLQGQLAKAASDSPPASPSDEERSKRLTESLMDQYEALQRMLEAQEAAADGTVDPVEAAARAMRERLAAQAARAAANVNAARMQASAREFLEAAWEAAGEKNIDPDNAVIVPGTPWGQGNWRIVIPDSAILDLEIIGLTRSDWARLPDTLREEVIQAAEDKAPAQYREVIKRYFKAISQRAGMGWDKPLLDETPKPNQPAKPGAKPGKK